MTLLSPKFARLQAALPRIIKFRLSRIPILVLFLLSGYAFYRYLSDPTNFDIFDALGLYASDEDYYDPHLYEWNKYPGAARAGDHQDHAAHSDDKRPSGLAALAGPGMDEIGQHHAQDGSLNYTNRDGLVRGWTLQGRSKKKVGKRLTHPIEELMRDNKQRWEGLLTRQSRSLEQAVREYKTRYGRLPPKGFDGWYKYCVDNNVKIIDDVSTEGSSKQLSDEETYAEIVGVMQYDQINHDIEPFLALSPAMFNERVDALATSPFTL